MPGIVESVKDLFTNAFNGMESFRKLCVVLVEFWLIKILSTSKRHSGTCVVVVVVVKFQHAN